MSSQPPHKVRNYPQSLAAFLLHRRRRVVRALILSITVLAVLPAYAQTMSGTGTCSGGMLAGTTGLALEVSGSLQDIQPATITYTFNAAECECPNDDIQLDIFLTAAFPQGTTGTAELWFGSGCDTNTTARTTVGQTVCQKVTTLDFGQFVVGSTSSSGHVYIPIQSLPLFSPVTNVCSTSNQSNGIYVLLFSGANSSPSGTPYATCSLQLTETVAGPGAPHVLSASSGDGAVSLSWGAASVTSAPIAFYQVLCADDAGNPAFSSAKTNVYSTCTPNGLERRIPQTGGSVELTDAGTISASEPLGPESVPGGPPPPDEPLATPDGGVDMATSDGGTPTTLMIGTTLPSPFTFLDTKYVCSGPIPPGSNGGSVRITGLNNGTAYQFVVVAVDAAGNPTPDDTGIVTATPQPVEDLYRRYRDQGGKGSGFCFIATAAYGSYESPFVEVLRQFRDEVLLPTHAGTSFVSWYYAHSPPAADYIRAHGAARVATQIALVPVIALAAVWLFVPLWLKLLALAALAWRIGRRRFRMRPA
jgi:hypothetical protein